MKCEAYLTMSHFRVIARGKAMKSHHGDTEDTEKTHR